MLKLWLKNIRSLHRRLRMSHLARQWVPDAQSLLVIAPHPDDETIGCGGVIALAKVWGMRVSILFLTRGGSSLRLAGVDGSEVAEARSAHAVRAAAALGLQPEDLIFWDLMDGGIPQPGEDGFAEAAARLVGVIAQGKPDVVFCPHPHDGWTDHTAAAALVQQALAGQTLEPKLYYYPIWTWHSAPWGMPGFDRKRALRVDISSVASRKETALDIYLHSTPSPAGVPFCGILPWSLIGLARWSEEVFFIA